MKNKKGITLIALVITVIILIILAGVAINLSIGENGIFRKAKYAKEQYTEQVLREKIELEITNLEIESLTTGENVTIEKVLETLLEKGIFESIDKEAGIGKTVEYEIKFKYDSNNNVIIEYVEQSIGKLKVTYTVEPENYIKEGTMTITLKVVGKVKSITKPDGLIIYPKIEQVGLDYDVTENGTYTFIIEDEDGKKIEKEVTVDKIDDDLPTAQIELETDILFMNGQAVANVTITDTKSGAGTSKWVINNESGEIGTEESLYTGGEITGKINKITTASLETPGTYYIHVLAKDAVGNSQEYISNAITVKDAYTISTVQDLKNISNNLSAEYYIVNNLDLSGEDWTPIGNNWSYFTGTLDGQGYKIKNLNAPLFAYVQNATIKNIKFENINIDKGNEQYMAAVASRAYNKNNLENIGVVGTIKAQWGVAGLIHNSNDTPTLINCYVRADVLNSDGNDYDLGGLLTNRFYGANITNCYFSGNTNAKGRKGPLIGSSDNSNSALPSGTLITHSYYNSDLYADNVPEGGGTPLTTSQFANQSNFEGWDFENTWIMKDGYPELRIFIKDNQ